jgi:hypothetical protein
MFSDNTIQNRVMTHVKTKIAIAQKKFDDGVKQICEDCENTKVKADAKRDADKVALADNLVNEIIGKFI